MAKRLAENDWNVFLVSETDSIVTTHGEDIPDLKSQYPHLKVLENQRFIREGKYVTSGGISAGIDMSLFLVSELTSKELAEKTAKQMEYRWQPGTPVT